MVLAAKQVCHPGKHAAAVVEKETGLAGVFIRGPGFCDSEKNMFFLTSVKARTPDKHAGKTSLLFNDSCGVFSGVTHLHHCQSRSPAMTEYSTKKQPVILNISLICLC
jgi:hypothetical protein